MSNDEISEQTLRPHQRVAAAMMAVLVPGSGPETDFLASVMDVEAASAYVESGTRTLMHAIHTLGEAKSKIEYDLEHQENLCSVATEQIIVLQGAITEYQEKNHEEFNRLKSEAGDLRNEIKILTEELDAKSKKVESLGGVVLEVIHHPELASLVLGDKFEDFLNGVKTKKMMQPVRILYDMGIDLFRAKSEVEKLVSEGIYATYKVPGAKRTLKQHEVYTIKAWRMARKEGNTDLPYKKWVSVKTNQNF